eukprot:1144208-Pelagomonas_calceolata.AAC.4
MQVADEDGFCTQSVDLRNSEEETMILTDEEVRFCCVAGPHNSEEETMVLTDEEVPLLCGQA